MPDPPKFTFGAPASTGASSSGLFGSTGPNKPLFGQSTGDAPKTSGGLFGNTTSTTSTESKSIFGSAAPAAGSSGFGFGQKPAESNGGGVFGSTAKTGGNSGFSFGQTGGSTTPAQTPTGTSAPSLFGQTSGSATSGGNLFGNLNKDANASQQQSSGSSTPATTKTAPMFSTTPAGNPPAATGGLFGNVKPAGEGTSLFGQKTDKPAASSFGQSSTSSGASLFGAKANDASASPAAQPPSLFGEAPKQGQSQSGASLFSKPAASSVNDATPKPAFSLPTAPASAANKPLFGEISSKSQSDKQPPKPTFSLGQPASSGEPSSSATAATSATPSAFSLNKSATVAPASTAPASTAPTASNLFSGLSQNKDTKEAAPASASKPSPFGSAKPADSQPAQSSPSLFNLSKPAANGTTSTSAPAASTATATATATTGTTASGVIAPGVQKDTSQPIAPSQYSNWGPAKNLGASTTGEAPPAASRLASKSLDEILTSWTTSLTAHQKSFGNMATKISGWDRQLVENSDKISKLYARTFQAERDTAEVERQLTAVEGEQQELERYLDWYENTVDSLITRNGGVEGGIDAERERTYRIAERCSTRLTGMSHDLASMIEEINSASSNLRQSTKSDSAQDPLTQIVKVLNGHLSQLQLIDQGASQLQQKVTAAQREARAVSRNGALGNDEVDAFARSYLGRR